MHTLVDPFELASNELPQARGGPEQQPGRDARGDAKTEPPATRMPSAEFWQRVRCWCSEE